MLVTVRMEAGILITGCNIYIIQNHLIRTHSIQTYLFRFVLFKLADSEIKAKAEAQDERPVTFN